MKKSIAQETHRCFRKKGSQVVDHFREQDPEHPEGWGKAWAGILPLMDPIPADGKLAFSSKESGRQFGS